MKMAAAVFFGKHPWGNSKCHLLCSYFMSVSDFSRASFLSTVIFRSTYNVVLEAALYLQKNCT